MTSLDPTVSYEIANLFKLFVFSFFLMGATMTGILWILIDIRNALRKMVTKEEDEE